ncbi:hypothetical protein D516_1282 [Rhodobacter sp. AKP1]|nr:hypothetical protein D516_1282 [Rhodobacter sp. AKP1]
MLVAMDGCVGHWLASPRAVSDQTGVGWIRASISRISVERRSCSGNAAL